MRVDLQIKDTISFRFVANDDESWRVFAASLEARIKMDYGSHLRRGRRLNMMKHIREKLLHPHHINKKWARQLRSNWTENKIAHTGALSLPSFLSHHQMNISQFHVDFCSEQNHSDVFVFLPVMSKLSPHQQWLPPAGPLTQTSVRFSVTGTNSNNVRMSRVFVSHTLTDTEPSGSNLETLNMIFIDFPKTLL